jgi:hypothetical protein
MSPVAIGCISLHLISQILLLFRILEVILVRFHQHLKSLIITCLKTVENLFESVHLHIFKLLSYKFITMVKEC